MDQFTNARIAAQVAAERISAEKRAEAARLNPCNVVPIDDSPAAKAREYRSNAPVTDALLNRLEAHHKRLATKAIADIGRQKLIDKWRPWAGTPETNEKIDRVPPRQRQSALARMVKLGSVTADELAAAHEIAGIVEQIARGSHIGSASLEARVDYASSGRDALIESLGRIRVEVAYRAWRAAIPKPQAMILDMIVYDVSYVRTAKRYGLDFQTARKRLLTALRLWPSMKIAARKEITKDEVFEVYQNIGEGTLLPPKPKAEQPKDQNR